MENSTYSYSAVGRPGQSLDQILQEGRDNVVETFRRRFNNPEITADNIFIDYRASQKKDMFGQSYFEVIFRGTTDITGLIPTDPNADDPLGTAPPEPGEQAGQVPGSGSPPLPPRPKFIAPTMTGALAGNLLSSVKKENILHSFKSYTYLFTLSGLEKTAIRIKETYDRDSQKYVIAKSSGKKQTGIEIGPRSLDAGLIASFNQQSPGRFNFYFEDVNVESLIGFDGRSGLSKATNITFTVVEPYSMNGFIEALQAVAIATGYADLRAATYLFTVEFIGYPDDLADPTKQSKAIPLGALGSRHFPIYITEIEVNASASGTRYVCKAIPINDLAFGKLNEMPANINVTPNPLTGAGAANTVGALCESMMRNINQAKLKEFTDSSTSASTEEDNTDTYSIAFPEKAYSVNTESKNIFYKSQITGLTSEDVNYQFANPATLETINNSDTKRVKYDPTKISVQFRQGANIHDCIAAIVRDCEVIQDRLYRKSSPETDSNGMIDYFYVHVDVRYKEKYNSKLNRYPMHVTYQVIPFKIHFNRVLGQRITSQSVPPTFDISYLKRKYYWIFTGKNKDISNFSLKLNTMFYHEMPLRGGTGDPVDSSYLTRIDGGPVSGTYLTDHASETERARGSAWDQTPIYMANERASNPQTNGYSTRPPGTNPYRMMAENFYNYLQTGVDTVELELEIAGDPYFLIQGGIGSSRPQPMSEAEIGLTETGEANHMVGEVYVLVEFKVPNDIDPRNGLLLPTQDTKTSFSGVYRVLEVMNKFSGGSFVQNLKMLRVPGFTTDPSKPSNGRPNLALNWVTERETTVA